MIRRREFITLLGGVERQHRNRSHPVRGLESAALRKANKMGTSWMRNRCLMSHLRPYSGHCWM
jgi:hypothetical protein